MEKEYCLTQNISHSQMLAHLKGPLKLHRPWAYILNFNTSPFDGKRVCSAQPGMKGQGPYKTKVRGSKMSYYDVTS